MADVTRDLTAQYEEELLALCNRCSKEIGYYPARFVPMVKRRGAVEATRRVIRKKGISHGLSRLLEVNRMDLSTEQFMIQPRWRPLFTPEEIAMAESKLVEVGYRP